MWVRHGQIRFLKYRPQVFLHRFYSEFKTHMENKSIFVLDIFKTSTTEYQDITQTGAPNVCIMSTISQLSTTSQTMLYGAKIWRRRDVTLGWYSFHRDWSDFHTSPCWWCVRGPCFSPIRYTPLMVVDPTPYWVHTRIDWLLCPVFFSSRLLLSSSLLVLLLLL